MGVISNEHESFLERSMQQRSFAKIYHFYIRFIIRKFFDKLDNKISAKFQSKVLCNRFYFYLRQTHRNRWYKFEKILFFYY